MTCIFYSTVSSGLNSLAAVVLEDFIKPWCTYRKKELSEIHATLYSKLLGEFTKSINNVNHCYYIVVDGTNYSSVIINIVIYSVVILPMLLCIIPFTALGFGALTVGLSFLATQLGAILQVCVHATLVSYDSK